MLPGNSMVHADSRAWHLGGTVEGRHLEGSQESNPRACVPPKQLGARRRSLHVSQ